MMTSLSNELDVITSGQILSIVGSKNSSPSYSTKYSHADISQVSVSAKKILCKYYNDIRVDISAKLTGFSRTSYISWISIHAWPCPSGDTLTTCDRTWMPTFPWSPVFTFTSGSITFTGLCSSTNTVEFTNTTIVTFTSLRAGYSLSFRVQIMNKNDPCLILNSDATGDWTRWPWWPKWPCWTEFTWSLTVLCFFRLSFTTNITLM